MKRVIALVVLFAAFTVYGEFKTNPDANTLWIEDGKAISGWRKEINMTENPEGGFYIEPGEKVDGGRYVPASPDYPWFVAELSEVEHKKGYRGFGFYGLIGMVDNPMTGIFTVRVPYRIPKPFFRIDVHGLKLGFKYMKVVREPENYIDWIEKDGVLEVTVKLKSEAEDVSVSFYDSYCMRQLTVENSIRLQLYPVDENNPVVWKGTLKNYKNTARGSFLLKATVLGGDIITPIWGVAPKKKKN